MTSVTPTVDKGVSHQVDKGVASGKHLKVLTSVTPTVDKGVSHTKLTKVWHLENISKS